MATLRRRGRWTYVPDDAANDSGWRLDGTTLRLVYDPLDSGSSLRGAWGVWLGQQQVGVYGIDHYLDGSMRWVEVSVEQPDSFGGGDPWARIAREQLAGKRCESQGCHCTPSLPCDEDGCDGQQHDDGASVSCSMCVRERVDMMESC